MNCFKTITLLITPLCIWTAALAQDSGGVNPLDPPIPAPVLTRAEVIADLQIWRESGAAALHRQNEGGTDYFSPAVLESVARYNSMRASPSFAMRVAKIAQERGEKLLISSNR